MTIRLTIEQCQFCPCLGDDTWPRCKHWEAPEVQEPPLNHAGCNPVPKWCPAAVEPQKLLDYMLLFIPPEKR